MTSIPVVIWIFSNSKFKRLYLKKERLFVDFFLHFWKMHEIENIVNKEKSILA